MDDLVSLPRWHFDMLRLYLLACVIWHTRSTLRDYAVLRRMTGGWW